MNDDFINLISNHNFNKKERQVIQNLKEIENAVKDIRKEINKQGAIPNNIDAPVRYLEASVKDLKGNIKDL